MKKYIILSITILCLLTLGVKAQIRLSSPIDKAVYQRDVSGNASISFAGQVPQIPCGTGNFLKYSITKISLQNGSLVSTITPFTTLSNDARGRFFFTSTLSTGWYAVTFQTYFGNNLAFTNSYKFGVGDVYIIAGQSNAQSIGLGDSPNQSPTTVQMIDVTYEAVVSCNYNESCQMGNGKMPRYPIFSTLASGTGVGSLGNAIAPNGFSNWCYTRLGNLLAAQGIPVAFFNAAFGASSIRAWYDSKNGGSSFCFVTPVAGEPYATLKKCLNYYGSLFGVRAVLWHQGESDNKFITNLKQMPDVTSNEYTYDLIALINQSRTDFNSQLPWVVSKASWNEGQKDTRITDAQTDLLAGLNPSYAGSPSRTNNSALSPIPILGVVTDTYDNSYRINTTSPLDQVHFNNNTLSTGFDGLRTLGDQWNTRLPLSSGTPISATPLQDITVVKNSSNFTMTAPSGAGYSYFWVAGNDRLDNKVSIGQSITISGGYDYKCFIKKPNGSIFLTTACYGAFICSNGANRESAEANDFSGTEDGVALKSYPNPSSDDFTIEFDVPFEAESVKVDLSTMTGETVKVVAQGSFAKGHYSYPMVGKELVAGTYVCRLIINEASYSTKMVKLGK